MRVLTALVILSIVGCAPGKAAKRKKAETTDTSSPETSISETLGSATVYAVRHFEKAVDEGSDPPLTEVGSERALALRDLMADVPLDAIFASDYLRTQLTVEPTAEAHSLEVDTERYPDDDLAEYILSEHRQSTVLSAGHSNTVPGFLGALGVDDDDLPDICGDCYGDLWQITIDGVGEVTLETQFVGEPLDTDMPD